MNKISKPNILLIGKIPPPIGGVTIHVNRLKASLELDERVDVDFYDLSEGIRFKLFRVLLAADQVHSHSSNVFLRLLLVILCRCLNKRSITTFHGNLGRYSSFKNKIDVLTVRLSEVPVVLNQGSYAIAQKHNRKSLLLSAYIPDQHIPKVLPKTIKDLQSIKDKGYRLICTNAYNLAFDDAGEEIYGISSLIKMIATMKGKFCVVLSDPTGNYQRYVSENNSQLIPYIYFVSYPHDFRAILKVSDAFVRNTNTDGDSLSVHEALECEIPSFCTDVVARPRGALVYGSLSQLKNMLENTASFASPSYSRPNTLSKIVSCYLS